MKGDTKMDNENNIAPASTIRRVDIRWKCRNCGYIHNRLQPPAECPTCNVTRLNFEKIETPLGPTNVTSTQSIIKDKTGTDRTNDQTASEAPYKHPSSLGSSNTYQETKPSSINSENKKRTQVAIKTYHIEDRFFAHTWINAEADIKKMLEDGWTIESTSTVASGYIYLTVVFTK